MELISGFHWPVPRAFAGAIATCRFEQGDVIYSDPAAYTPGAGGCSAEGDWVQVLSPPKTTRVIAGQGAGARFEGNWRSRVELALRSQSLGKTDNHVCTQGHLFTCLWRGEVSWLKSGAIEPPVPAPLRDLQARLDQAQPTFERLFLDRLQQRPFTLFLFALDDSSDASRSKARSIEEAVSEAFAVERQVLSPPEAGIEDPDAVHPAFRIAGLAVTSAGTKEVEARIRRRLYAGPDREGGRFSLARHGRLQEVTGEDA